MHMGTAHTVDALTCGTVYQLQVNAFSDRVRRPAAWGTRTAAVSAAITAGDDADTFAIIYEGSGALTVAAALNYLPSLRTCSPSRLRAWRGPRTCR